MYVTNPQNKKQRWSIGIAKLHPLNVESDHTLFFRVGLQKESYLKRCTVNNMVTFIVSQWRRELLHQNQTLPWDKISLIERHAYISKYTNFGILNKHILHDMWKPVVIPPYPILQEMPMNQLNWQRDKWIKAFFSFLYFSCLMTNHIDFNVALLPSAGHSFKGAIPELLMVPKWSGETSLLEGERYGATVK